jgi:hypothetical protein
MPYTDERDTDFAIRLTKEIGVASYTYFGFYRKGAPTGMFYDFVLPKGKKHWIKPLIDY